MRLGPRSCERRRDERRARKQVRRRREIEKEFAKRTAFRGRDERTGGYGDHTYPGP